MSPLRTCPSPTIQEPKQSSKVEKNIILSQTANTVSAMSQSDSNCLNINGGLKTHIRASDSFFSKDHENVIVSKLAAKLDCSSVMERRSKEFKSIDPKDAT